MKTLASILFLLDAVIIGLGAFGHGLQAQHVHQVLDPFPIESDLGSMIYVVWYFVSGCMLTFGITLPALIEASLSVSAYSGPSGKGYVLHADAISSGTRYRRSENVGPATWLTHGWTSVKQVIMS